MAHANMTMYRWKKLTNAEGCCKQFIVLIKSPTCFGVQMSSSGGYLFLFLNYSSFSLRFGWMGLSFAWCGHLLRNASQSVQSYRFNEHNKLLTTSLSISWFPFTDSWKCSIQRSSWQCTLSTFNYHLQHATPTKTVFVLCLLRVGNWSQKHIKALSFDKMNVIVKCIKLLSVTKHSFLACRETR
jgi:hypothetical protein